VNLALFLLSTLFLLAGLILYINNVKKRHYVVKLFFSFGVFVFIILSIFFFISDSFTGKGVDESVLYHLQYGLQGAGFGEYPHLIIGGILGVCFSIALSIIIYKLPKGEKVAAGSKKKIILSCLCLWLALVLHPASIGLMKQVFFVKGGDDVYLKNYMQEAKIEAVDDEHYNLVVIYLEGQERTYFDETRFPGLITHLRELEKNSITFTNMTQSYGSRWTIAGMVASQCGIPLMIPGSAWDGFRKGNSMSGMSSFLSRATCLGDILKNYNYYLVYMGGCYSYFAGKRTFYNTHQFDEILGLRSLLPLLPDQAYQTSWGLYDDSLFELAFEKFTALYESEQPFGLFLLTLDTHQATKGSSQTCNDIIYHENPNNMLNAVKCTDYLVGDFVQKIMDHDRDRNTIVVILSDHLALKNEITDILDRGERTNLFMVLLPDGRSKDVNKKGSTFDVGCTLLNLLNLKTERLGLGRDLLDDNARTFVERFPNHYDELHSQKSYFLRLWNIQQIKENIVISNQRINFDDDDFCKIPAIVKLNDQAETEEIIFSFSTRKKCLEDIKEFDADQPFVWVDKCLSVRELDNTLPSEGYCALIGSLNGTHNLSFSIDEPRTISKQEILNIIRENTAAPPR